ncbi:hypothetical protein EI613_09955 [Azospirillum sp. 412522]|nr:hypothetical protein [Azospirillum sp. 412522]MBY6262236.1 hypothetical protein [Azospirillum sp. 412522]
MARLPALVTALAKFDGRDRAALEHVARAIREAGYIPTTKRGVGAANMTAREAVNLLLAVNGADSVKDAPLAVDRFRSLELHDHLIAPECDLALFREIIGHQTLGQGLECLIDGMGEFLAAACILLRTGYSENQAASEASQSELLSGPWDTPFHFSVSLHRYSAEILCKIWVQSQSGGGEWRTLFYASYIVSLERLASGFYGNGSDRRYRKVSVHLDGRLLFGLFAALMNEEAGE